MVGVDDVVITGIGCVSPIGIGRPAMLAGLLEQRCAIRKLYQFSDPQRTAIFGAEIDNFDGKQYVTPRKALKVMSHEIQLAYSAAHLAWQDAGLTEATLEPDRLGVVFGAEIVSGHIPDLLPAVQACSDAGRMDHSQWGTTFAKQIYPLWMLKNLPNMPACHIGIAIDARGPNNTIAQEEVGGVLALAEAAAIISRGQADLMIAGAVSSRVAPTRLIYRPRDLYDHHPLDSSENEPRCVPFDARRRGILASEGSAAIVLERRRHAVRRGAPILATVLAAASRCAEPSRPYGGSRQSIAAAASAALDEAAVDVADLAHISAQGFSETYLDIEEAAAITKFGPTCPVTAFSSYFGTAGSACGMLELVASILSVHGRVSLPTLGYQVHDPDCDIRITTQQRATSQDHFLKLSFTPMGHAAAVVIRCAN